MGFELTESPGFYVFWVIFLGEPGFIEVRATTIGPTDAFSLGSALPFSNGRIVNE